MKYFAPKGKTGSLAPQRRGVVPFPFFKRGRKGKIDEEWNWVEEPSFFSGKEVSDLWEKKDALAFLDEKKKKKKKKTTNSGNYKKGSCSKLSTEDAARKHGPFRKGSFSTSH